jgi:hypothetical protein
VILFFFTVGIYSNLYIYQSFRADIVFSGALLPWGGYIFGGLSAWICRLEWKLIKVSSDIQFLKKPCVFGTGFGSC